MRIVIATFNSSKAREMVEILGARFPDIQWKSLVDYSNALEPEETGATYESNALIKAVAAAQQTGEICVADDAGLEIDALNGAPGLFSKRFGGEELSFPKKMDLILQQLAEVRPQNRTARFRCWVAVAWQVDGGATDSRTFEGICEGTIIDSPRGSGGFGYDPIFQPEGSNVTMAELTAEQKHVISHRGKVLKLVGDFLEAHIGTISPDGDARVAGSSL